MKLIKFHEATVQHKGFFKRKYRMICNTCGATGEDWICDIDIAYDQATVHITKHIWIDKAAQEHSGAEESQNGE